MARLPLPPLFLRAIPVRWILSLAAATTLLAGCASLPDFSALENDELYLSRGEEFVTDSKYLAFAMDQAGVEDLAEDDYYDANRSAYGEGYMGGYGGPSYQPSFNNPYRPFSNGLGLQSYFNPMSGYGMGMGMGYGGFSGMNYGMNNGFGYNNMGYNNMGYNPYGFNGWNNAYNPYGYYNTYGNNGWNNGYSGWGNNGNAGPYFGSVNGEGSGVTSFTRTPIMSYTNNGSNYDDAGVLVRPKTEREDATEDVQPTVVKPQRNKRQNRWMQATPSTETRSTETRSTRTNSNSNWNSRSRSGGSDNSIKAPTSTPRSNATRSSGSNSRSSGSSPRGSSTGSSRSSRGGGK